MEAMNMNTRTKYLTGSGRVLGMVLAAALMPGSGVVAAGNASGWKIPPDPEIVNFKRADAEVVTQTLVAPPFLPDHTQIANGPPKLVKIRMDIVERNQAPGFQPRKEQLEISGHIFIVVGPIDKQKVEGGIPGFPNLAR